MVWWSGVGEGGVDLRQAGWNGDDRVGGDRGEGGGGGRMGVD